MRETRQRQRAASKERVAGRNGPPGTNAVAQGYLFAIGATLMWSGNFIVARSFHQQLPPIGLAFWRWLTAACLLAPFMAGVAIRRRREIRRHIRYLSLTALIGITIVNPLVYAAGRTTSAVNLSLIAISTPLFMIVLSRFLYGEKITLIKITGMVITIGGLLLLISGGSLQRLVQLRFTPGDLLMVLSAFTFAVYSVMTKMKPAELPVMLFLFVIITMGVVFMFPFYLWEYAVAEPPRLTLSLVFGIAYVALFASLFSYGLWSRAISSIGPANAGMIYYLIPVFSGIAAHFLLGERAGMVQLISMILIVFGICVASRPSPQMRKERKR